MSILKKICGCFFPREQTYRANLPPTNTYIQQSVTVEKNSRNQNTAQKRNIAQRQNQPPIVVPPIFPDVIRQNVPPTVPQNIPSSARQNIPNNILQNVGIKIPVQIRLINSLTKEVVISNETTGQQLKELIYTLSKELGIDSMSLFYEGVKITKNMKLKELRIVVGSKLKIVQMKADIAEVAAVIADVHGIDPLTDQVGTAKMCCGHHIGKDSMTMLVRSLISSNKYEIRCPNNNEDDLPCLTQWQFKTCRKVGVFTKSEVEEFQNGLSQNWIKENAKQCPGCKLVVSKYQLQSNRVKCPKCEFGDFCYLCLNPWKGQNNKFCGNEQCKFLNDFVSNSPWNRKFVLIDLKDGNKKKDYLTPQYRACVHCSTIIQHSQACKHMPCKSCKKSFCWVCLSVPNNGNYPCGAFNHYCGKVAQAQRFNKAPTN